jgi:DNA topoisomerase-1
MDPDASPDNPHPSVRAFNMSENICKGCIAIIAEKPRAAAKIAGALSYGKAKKLVIQGVPLWVFSQNGREYVVIPSAGHLFSIDTDKPGIPVFEYKWVPRYEAEKGYSHLKRFYHVFSKILPKAVEYINACDYDIEGSLIGYKIVEKWGDISRMKRMKFSSLVEEELRKSFKNLEPPDLHMVEAGLARHEMDWIWGINISRALMQLFRKIFSSNRVLSAGRVQTPTLFEVVRNTLERSTFVPRPLYNVEVYVDIAGNEYRLEHGEEPFKRRSDAMGYAEKVKGAGYVLVINVDKRFTSYQPPHPYNLGDIQKDAYSIYRISPARTLQILEDLYLDSLISYPRTNSQRLPSSIDHRGIIEKISNMPRYGSAALKLLRKDRLIPNNGPMEDPAHPAIYPTGEIPRRLSDIHGKVYDLIVRRYLATFMDPLIVESIRIEIDASGRRYLLHGSKINYKGWLEIYPFYKIEEREIPRLKIGDRLRISRVKIAISYTRPEPPYNKATLLKWMENVGIGTEATRAEIIETLYKRGYIKGSDVTSLGLMVCSAIERYFRDISSVELTRRFEEMLEKIRRGELKREYIIKETKKVVGDAIKKFLMSIENLGSNEIRLLGTGLGGCPICKDPSDPVSKHGFCMVHEIAYRRLIETYNSWKENGISWREYIERISKLKITGSKVKELTSFLP